jgi:NADH-quinone oxidoreductase subunit N
VSSADFQALLPLVAVAATTVVVLLAIAVRRSHRAVFWISAAGLSVALARVALAFHQAPREIGGLLVADGLSLLYTGLVLGAGLVLVLLSYGYLRARRILPEEFYPLLLLSILGAAVLAWASHFATLFLGLELLSVGLFVLIAYPRARQESLEAGLKYLVLAGVSSAFVLFGLALLYYERGTLRLAELTTGGPFGPLAWAGLVMVLVGLGFKLALVPFHLWTPDVFQGSPMPVAALIATVSKGSVFALLLRGLQPVLPSGVPTLVLTVLAVASMFAGNLLALLQGNLKRLLGYSSIAHVGYLLVAFLAGGAGGAAAVSFYLLAYFLTSLAAFGALSVLSPEEGGDVEELSDLRGLAHRRPLLTGILVVALLSLAGIPVTAGFIGKFYLLAAGIQARLWLLSGSLVASSVIGLYYYLRVILGFFLPAEEAPQPVRAAAAASASSARGPAPRAAARSLLLGLVTAALLGIGLYPGPVIGWISGLLAR